MALEAKTAEEKLQKINSVRSRYELEAKKRYRVEGTGQFVPLKEAEDKRLRDLADDPWVDHDKLNAGLGPIRNGDTARFFIVGAGFGGLQFAVRLISTGLATADDIRFADAAGGVGGTWYWNRFPGLHCDIESYIYLPLLEETGYVPRSKYASGEEIRLHAERIASRWDLADKVLYRTDVKSVVWDNAGSLWKVHVLQGRGPDLPPLNIEFKAHYVYLAAGVLTRPKIPRIPGLWTFCGDIFHTARWNYSVSGGSPELQDLTGLYGKRVAVVGTAATAIAVIPEVAKFAGELFVVQRTPAYVKERKQKATDPDSFAREIANQKGWQWQRQLNFNAFISNSFGPGQKNLVDDAWTDQPAYSAVTGSRRYGIVENKPETVAGHIARFHELDLPNMEANRARVKSLVKDADTASKLEPWYPSWCKRPTFSDVYLQTFNRPNVHLVDTDGKGLSSVTENGIVVHDKEIPLDIIIFSTGYEVGGTSKGDPSARTGVEIVGRDGQTLTEKWKSEGAATLHGYATHGFPNLFFSGSSQATVTGNNIWMLNIIARHVVYILAAAQQRTGRNKRAVVEVTKEGEDAHTAEIVRRTAFYAPLAGCTPGYFNSYGQFARDSDADKKKTSRGATWAEGTLSFLDYLEKWRDEGKLQGYRVDYVSEGIDTHL